MKNHLLILCLLTLTLSCNKDGRPSLNKKSVGKSANDLLSSDKYEKLTIELVSVEGFELAESVIADFKAFAESLLNKPSGIQVKSSVLANPGLAPYSTEDIISLEDQIRTEFNDGKEIAVFILITDGAYTNDDVLGVAYRNTSFALFGGKIKELTGGIGQPPENLVIQTVLQHELGHLLGLVNVGTSMQSNHQDSNHGHHCDVKSCLMYYAVETGSFLDNLIGAGSPPDLDNQCLADLKANGGK